MDDNMKRETATSTLSGGQRTIEELITSMMNVMGGSPHHHSVIMIQVSVLSHC